MIDRRTTSGEETMTSGQGSGQPPYGEQPPQGYPPYGQQPGQGYMPAPAAPSDWGREAPRPVERPVAVRAGLGAFIGSIVLSLVGSVVTLLNWDRFVVYIERETQAAAGSTEVPLDAEQLAELGLRIGLAVSVVTLVVYLLFIWFAWKGHNWARIVLWVIGGIGVVFGLVGLASGTGSGPFPFVTALGWFQLIFLAAGIVLLARPPANDWYRYRKFVRATGQGR
jgi:hypothetical protein